MLDLRKLVHLVAVSENGSISRAARDLHLTQQALSGSIRALEREVGLALMERRGSGVALLPAGDSVVADARVLHGLAEAALRRARLAASGEVEPLRIAHTPAVTVYEVTEALHTVRARHPELATDVNQRYPFEMTEQLLRGEIDIGLCREMRPEQGLIRTELGSHRLSIAVARDHRLAERESVTLGDLAGEQIIVWGYPERSGYTDFLLQICRDAGFEPRWQRNPIQGTPPVTAVLGSAAVAFVTDPPGVAAGGRVRVLELQPVISAALHAITAQHVVSPMRDLFLKAVVPEPGAGTPAS